MRVDRLTIEGFRGFWTLTLDFDPRLTVIVGENGVGKTSLLDAVALMLDQYQARYVRASASSARRLRDSDLHKRPIAVSAEISATTFKDAISSALESLNFDTIIKIEITEQQEKKRHWEICRQTRKNKLNSPRQSGFGDLNNFVRQRAIRNNALLNGEPLMIFYGQRRAILDVPDRLEGDHDITMSDALGNTLSNGAINFRDFTRWFRDRSHIELEQHEKEYKYDGIFRGVNNSAQHDKQLETVRNAIILATGLERPHYSALAPSGIYVGKSGKNLRVDQLSSGEQSYLALVGDLARRLAMLNPDLSDPLTGAGIILIDEIELHLHPRWQRQIIPGLLRTFPNCQFIITTHSPQVLGQVAADNIRILQADEAGTVSVTIPSATKGRDSNFLLLSVLGGDERDSEIKQRLHDLELAIAKGALDQAQTLLSALRDDIEGSPPELSIAEARLERRRYKPK